MNTIEKFGGWQIHRRPTIDAIAKRSSKISQKTSSRDDKNHNEEVYIPVKGPYY